jgi:hypothetical protein
VKAGEEMRGQGPRGCARGGKGTAGRSPKGAGGTHAQSPVAPENTDPEAVGRDEEAWHEIQPCSRLGGPPRSAREPHWSGRVGKAPRQQPRRRGAVECACAAREGGGGRAWARERACARPGSLGGSSCLELQRRRRRQPVLAVKAVEAAAALDTCGGGGGDPRRRGDVAFGGGAVAGLGVLR